MKNGLTKDKITGALSRLVGLPAWEPTLAAGMLMISFGQRHNTTRNGKTIALGDYSLHIQCAWRLARSDEIVVGFADYVAAEDEQSLTRVQKRLQSEFSESPVVGAVDSVRGGAFSIALMNGLYIDAFPSLSAPDPDAEFWRMFSPNQSDRHFVVTPKGIELI